jgi:hypothetical protein
LDDRRWIVRSQRGSSVSAVTGTRVGFPADIFLPYAPHRPSLDSLSLVCNECQNVKLTTNDHLVPTVRMHGPISPLLTARSLFTAKLCRCLAQLQLRLLLPSAAVLNTSLVLLTRCTEEPGCLTIGHHGGTDGRDVCSLSSAAARLASFHLVLFLDRRCVSCTCAGMRSGRHHFR